jgi:hypothetical protein
MQDQAEHNCLHYRGMIDELDLFSDAIATAKGMTERELAVQRRKSSRRIEQTLRVQDFLSWCERRSWEHYPYINGYRDPELIGYVDGLSEVLFPFNVPTLQWNIGRVCASVTKQWWKEYYQHKGIDSLNVTLSIGVSPAKVEEILHQFRSAHKRAQRASPS